MNKQENHKDNNTRDRIIEIVLLIIIILLLLHNCSLLKKKGNGNIDKEKNIDISCYKEKCQHKNTSINCMQDENNKLCLIPNFVGETKKEALRWLDSISDTIELEIKIIENPEYADGEIIDQSITGISVKQLINDKQKLVITIVNNGSLIDCVKDSKNSKCKLPNFIGAERTDVEQWINSIVNNIPIKFIYVDSNKKTGTILNQSVIAGTLIRDILNSNQTVIIYISGKNVFTSISEQRNDGSSQDLTPEPEPDPEPELDEFYVSDKVIIKWQDQTDLNIFEDSSNISKVNGKIAPESTGTYKFVINNGTVYDLNYKITFQETNNENMNMKFKLKKGNTYLIDHYVSSEDLNINNILINTNKSQVYYLEWKWVGDNDDNDTTIGKKANNNDITYSLKINVEAESTDE